MPTETATAGCARLLRAIAALLVLQGLAIALYAWVQRDRRPAPRLAAEAVDRPAPALAFTRADGTRGTLDELRGRPVLVHFWASWCIPCREELPQLLELAGEMANELAVVAVAVEDDWDAVGRFFGGAAPRQVVAETDDGGARRFGVSTLPDTFLVDAGGDIRLRFHGARDWADDRMPDRLRDGVRSRENDGSRHADARIGCEGVPRDADRAWVDVTASLHDGAGVACRP